MSTRSALSALALFLFVATGASAAVPSTLSYQGKLAQPSGVLVGSDNNAIQIKNSSGSFATSIYTGSTAQSILGLYVVVNYIIKT